MRTGLTLLQTNILDANVKSDISWLFEIDRTGNGSVDDYWSTKAKTWNGQAYTFKIIEFSDIKIERGRAEYGIQAPSSFSFTLSNKNNTLRASAFTGGTVTLRIVVKADISNSPNSGSITLSSGLSSEALHNAETEIMTFAFDIVSVVSQYQTLVFECRDWLQKYTETSYPNTKIIDALWPSTENSGGGCVPLIFGTCYIPLDSAYITNDRFLILGPASANYDITKTRSPIEVKTITEWVPATTVFEQSTKAGSDSVNYRVFQLKVAVEDPSGNFLWKAWGSVFGGNAGSDTIMVKVNADYLSMPTKFSRTDTVSLTNPADVLQYILLDFGIPSSKIDATTLADVRATFNSWSLSWNLGLFTYIKRKDLLAKLLQGCHLELLVRDKIYFKIHSKTPQRSIVADMIVSGSFTTRTHIPDKSDSGYVLYPDPNGNLPVNVLTRKIVGAKGTAATVSNIEIDCSFVPHSINAQKLAILSIQRQILSKAEVSFTSKGKILVLEPDDVIKISDANYGGGSGYEYNVLIDSFTIKRDLSVDITATMFSDTLDDWADLTVYTVTPSTSVVTTPYQVVIAGPDSPTNSGSTIPNLLPGNLRVGSGSNYIHLDPSFPLQKFVESSITRLKIGNIGTVLVPDYGLEILDHSGISIMKLDGAGVNKLAGWTISGTAFTADSGVVGMSSAATVGVDWRFWAGHATPGSAPFRVDESGNLYASSATISGAISAPWSLVTDDDGNKPDNNATVGADWGSNLSSIPSFVNYPGAGAATGLYLTSTYMGYWLAGSPGAWKTYMDSSGNMYLVGAGGNHLAWSASTSSLTIGTWNVIPGYIYSLVSGTPTSSPSDGIVLASTNPRITCYENTEKRLEVGYLSAGVFGLKGYDDDGTTVLFEISDTQKKFAGWTINPTSLSVGRTSITGGSAGIWIGTDGISLGANVATPEFKVLASGALTATSATITGAITATSGSFSGDILVSGTLQTSALATTGLKFSSAGIKGYGVSPTQTVEILVDGTGWLGAATTLSWTSAGVVTIGGFTATATALYAGAVATRVQLDTTSGIHLGATAFADAPFSVSLAGVLKATSATITGEVNANTGKIGGVTNYWNITSGAITSVLAATLTMGSVGSSIKIGTLTSYDPNTTNIGLYADGTGNLLLKSGTSANTNYLQFLSNAMTIHSSAFTLTTTTLKISSTPYISMGTATPTSATVGTGIWMDGTGIFGLNANNQRFKLLQDGSGYLGATSVIAWGTDGVVTVAGWTVNTTSLSSTNIGLHAATYGEGAEILLGHATAYASAKIGLKADGSGKLASGNIAWDTSGNITIAGSFTSTATITGGTVQTAVSGARTVLDSNGLAIYDATTQRAKIGSDGAGWLGAATTFSWTSAGVLTAGGWTVNNVALFKDTGVDATSAGMAPGDYPFYAGKQYADRATAPFRVSNAGILSATGATISGAITGGTIAIGATPNWFCVDNTGNIWLGADTYNIATNPFAVSKAGVLRAVSGTIGGCTLATTSIGSTVYTSGLEGWNISNTGSAEFSNVRIRGELSSAVFKFDEIHATAGTFGVFLSGSTLSADCTTVEPAPTFTLTAKDSDDGGQLFAVNDILRIKSWDGTGVRDNWMTVTVKPASSGGSTAYTCVKIASGSGGGTATTFKKGTSIIDYGPSGTGFITLSADGAVGSTPNMTMGTHAGSPWTTITSLLRIGNLNGSYGIVSDLYGIGIGTYGTDAASRYLRYDTSGGLIVAGDIKTNPAVGAGTPGQKGIHLSTSANELYFYGDETGGGTSTALLASIGITDIGPDDTIIKVGSTTSHLIAITAYGEYTGSGTIYVANSSGGQSLSANVDIVEAAERRYGTGVSSTVHCEVPVGTESHAYAIGFNANVTVGLGSNSHQVDTMRGMNIVVGSAANMTNTVDSIYGIRIEPWTGGTGTRTTVRGLYIVTPSVTGATVTNYHSIYQEDPAATNYWAGNHVLANGVSIGQAAGPLLTFDDTNNYLEITGCKVGFGITNPSGIIDVGSATAGRAISWGGVDGNYANIWTAYSAGDLVLASGLRGDTGSDAYVSSSVNSFGRIALRFDMSAGALLFYTNAASVVADGTAIVPTQRMVLDSSGYLGIGVTPTNLLHLYSTSALEIIAEGDGAASDFVPKAYGTTARPGISGYRAKGTKGTPLAITADQILLFFGGRGYGATAFATQSTGAVIIRASETFTDSAWGTYIDFQTTPIGSVTRSERMRITDVGCVHINETSNANMTLGLTINQAANADEILAFKGSSIAHGMTAIAETDTYGNFRSNSNTIGGLLIQGFSEVNRGVATYGFITTPDTTTSTAGDSAVRVDGLWKSGDSSTSLGNDDNVFIVGNAGYAKFIVKGDGDIYYDGADQGTYDAFDDALACQDLSYNLSNQLSKVLKYNKGKLHQMGVIKHTTHDNGKEDIFVSRKGMDMLQLGAIGELYRVCNKLCNKLGITFEEAKCLQ